MVEGEFANRKSFVVSQKLASSSRQPLELYHLSHDLRSPLNSILGFAELMLQGIEGPLNEHQQTDLVAIRQSAKNLLWLIDTVVDLSKLEAEQLDFNFDPVDLNQVIQEIMAYDFGTNKPESVELVSDVPDLLPPIWGVQDRIKQMVLGLVRFGFRMRTTGQVTIGAISNARKVTIQVNLEGVTLPDDQLTGLFDLVVYRDDSGHSDLGLGGLELPLTRALAEQHNGRVWVESDKNEGVAFYLSLPVNTEID